MDEHGKGSDFFVTCCFSIGRIKGGFQLPMGLKPDVKVGRRGNDVGGLGGWGEEGGWGGGGADDGVERRAEDSKCWVLIAKKCIAF